MTAKLLTLLSGVALLLVFALVGWYRWRRDSLEHTHREKRE